MNISDDLQKVINKAKSSEEFKKQKKPVETSKLKRQKRSQKPKEPEKFDYKNKEKKDAPKESSLSMLAENVNS